MKVLTTLFINPLLYGNWVLRVSNDNRIEKGLNYIQIQEEPLIKMKTLKQEGFFGIKKSRTAYVSDVTNLGENKYSFKLKFSQKNIYSYSFIGIQIPEYRSNSFSYIKENNYTIDLVDKTLIMIDEQHSLYYIFDLQIGKLHYPNIETSFTTFLFTQIFSIAIGLIFTKLL